MAVNSCIIRSPSGSTHSRNLMSNENEAGLCTWYLGFMHEHNGQKPNYQVFQETARHLTSSPIKPQWKSKFIDRHSKCWPMPVPRYVSSYQCYPAGFLQPSPYHVSYNFITYQHSHSYDAPPRHESRTARSPINAECAPPKDRSSRLKEIQKLFDWYEQRSDHTILGDFASDMSTVYQPLRLLTQENELPFSNDSMDSLAEAKKAGRPAIIVKSIQDVAENPDFEICFKRVTDTKSGRQMMNLYDPADKSTEKMRKEASTNVLQHFRDRQQAKTTLTAYY